VKRKLVWAGAGARGHDLEQYNAPVVLTWGGADLLPTDHPMNCGIVGVCGQPGANTAVAEADEILVVGSGLHLTQTGGREIKQCRQEDVKNFWFLEPDWDDVERYKKLNEMPDVGSYAFNKMMTRMLGAGAVMVVDGGGTALYTGFQSSYIKQGSRLICSTAISAMGSGLPEAVGACLASGKRLTTCLIGDGSFMFNIQELATIRHHNLPIKIFILNNGGYLAIRHTQDGFLGGRHCGVDETDLSFPSFGKVARAFDIPYIKETDAESVGKLLEMDGPAICEVMVPKDQKMVRQGFKLEGDRYVPQPLSEMVYG